ncbi:CAP domain-containing protein [Salipaludibacillus daqingensis]|uniref:CAP domain-containing protein n=1 Tax=Salipaludibacillus daqingensis TaxID=3041001 RepID=UPI002476E62A|nr:CAP domain-containing protein [Salipaludibacillus daqingensis]
MKSLFVFTIGLLLIIGIAFIGVNLLDDITSQNSMDSEEVEMVQIDKILGNDEETTDEENESGNRLSSEGDVESENDERQPLYDWIGLKRDDLIDVFGEPDRRDATPYGYEWYVYYSKENHKQFGVDKDNQVVSAYTNSENVFLGEFEVRDHYDIVSSIYEFNQENTISKTLASYTFELKEEELVERPLAQTDEGVWAQFYFDKFTGELSSVRYLDENTLLVQRPYSLSYNGDLPEKESLEGEKIESWQYGQAKQILELTNGIRRKHDLSSLAWHDGAAQTAFLHSEEMYELNYFSHTSENEGELSDRLIKQDVSYRMAAENIAAKYVDGIAAVEGWLNSEGHRVNLLNDDLTHLGVGVYEDYYTQNFISP